MKKIDLTCPKCGAIMDINEEQTEANCSYCRYKFLIEKDETLEEAKKRVHELAYEYESGKYRAQREHEAKSKFKKTLGVIIALAILFIGVLVFYYSREYIEDPFEGVNVTFSGIDGMGTAEITFSNKKNSDINYKLSKDNNLSEDEEIKIRVSSENYRFGQREKTYKVEGLLKYLSKLEDISESQRKTINEKSSALLRQDVENGYSFEGTITELTPYKFYLGTKSKGNYLFDIFKIKIKTSTGKVFEKYVVAEYENIIITDDVFKFTHLERIGNSILAGDPKQYTVLSDDYAGFLFGFESINELDNYIEVKYDDIKELTKE